MLPDIRIDNSFPCLIPTTPLGEVINICCRVGLRRPPIDPVQNYLTEHGIYIDKHRPRAPTWEITILTFLHRISSHLEKSPQKQLLVIRSK